MKTISRTVALAALGLLLSGAAQASTLFTPPADHAFADENMTCLVSNVRAKPITVNLQALTYFGTVVSSYSTTLDPGHIAAVDGVQNGAAFCKFTVGGPKTAVRASVTYWTNNFTPTVAIQAK